MSKTGSTAMPCVGRRGGKPLESRERLRQTAPWIDPGALALAELVVLRGGEVGRRYPIYGGEVIGRSDEADIVIDVDEVSRRHCALRRSGGSAMLGAPTLEIEDLGSNNGTWIRGLRIEGTHGLSMGERVVVGGVELLIARPEPEGDDRASLHRYEVTRRILASAAYRLHAAMGTSLGGIDAIRRLADGAAQSSELQVTLATLLGSLREHSEVSRQLRLLTAAEPNREGRVDLGALCHDVSVGLMEDAPHLDIRDETVRVEVRGDLVELYEVVDGAARHLLHHLPVGGALIIRCRQTASPSTPRHRIAEIQLARTAADSALPLGTLELPAELVRCVAVHGGHVEPLEEGDALGHRIVLSAVTPPRRGTTVKGDTGLGAL